MRITTFFREAWWWARSIFTVLLWSPVILFEEIEREHDGLKLLRSDKPDSTPAARGPDITCQECGNELVLIDCFPLNHAAVEPYFFCPDCKAQFPRDVIEAALERKRDR